MNFPTVLSPWFVIQKVRTLSMLGEMYYYSSSEGGTTYEEDPKRATVFESLVHASRIALAEGAHVRVLTTKEEAKEFGRE